MMVKVEEMADQVMVKAEEMAADPVMVKAEEMAGDGEGGGNGGQ